MLRIQGETVVASVAATVTTTALNVQNCGNQPSRISVPIK